MDFSDPHVFALFLEVYGSLPRAGPGAPHYTLRALELVPTPTIRRVLICGAGPGAETLDLAAALPDADLLAVDILPEMVAEGRRRVSAAGLAPRVHYEVADMLEPGAEAGSVDLVWCEGAIYNVGIEAALAAWRPLLSPHGAVAFTEPVWLKAERPDELSAWWQSEYPAITDVEGIRAHIERAGYALHATFNLGSDAWWDAYYAPMEPRIEALLAAHPDDDVAAGIAAMARKEIAMFRAYPDAYSYAFFIVTPR